MDAWSSPARFSHKAFSRSWLSGELAMLGTRVSVAAGPRTSNSAAGPGAALEEQPKIVAAAKASNIATQEAAFEKFVTKSFMRRSVKR